MFQGRKLLIATKHKKENMIAPIFEKELVKFRWKNRPKWA